MAYTSDKKPGALTAATILDGNNNVVVEQSGDVKRATLSQVEAKIFDAKTATTTPTGTEVVVVRQTDNTLRQVALADIVPAGNIVDAKISASAAIADTKLATINTAGKVTNNAVQAVSTNTANRIVTRDSSGNFAAGTITATLAGSITGNAPTATILATGRTVALTGDVTGTTGAFNGSANVSAATTIANNAVTTAKIADANVTTAKIADANVTNVKIASGVDAAKLTTGTLPAARIGNDAIDAAKIASNAVTDVKIASGVDAAKLTTGTLPIARIADGAVTDAKLADGAVTAPKLASGAAIPAGAVMPFAMSSAPTGWLVANGDAVPNGSGTVQGVTADFSALYAAVSTAFGTAGTLPDLRGIFVRGSGSQTISGIAYNKTFATKEGDAFQGHRHTSTTANVFRFGPGVNTVLGGSTFGVVSFNVTDPSSDGTNGAPRTSSETRPANIAMLYCIKH